MCFRTLVLVGGLQLWLLPDAHAEPAVAPGESAPAASVDAGTPPGDAEKEPTAGAAGTDAGIDESGQRQSGEGSTSDPQRVSDGASATSEQRPSDTDSTLDEQGFSDEAGFGPATTSPDAVDDESGFADDTQAIARAPEPIGLRLLSTSRISLWAQRLNGEPLALARQTGEVELARRFPYAWGALRIVLGVHAEYDFAYLSDRERYDPATLDAYQWLVRPTEAWVGVFATRSDIGIGWQVLPWGRGMLLSPLDLIAPRDSRIPGIVELESLRLPVLAAKAGVTWEPFDFKLIVLGERANYLRPAPLSEMSPLRPALLAADAPRGIHFADSPSRFSAWPPATFGELSFEGEGYELSLHGAYTYDPIGVLGDLGEDPSRLALEHKPWLLLGHSGTLPTGSWILRWEQTFEPARPLNVVPVQGTSQLQVEQIRTPLTQWMLGVGYSGIAGLDLTLEYQQGYLLKERRPPLFRVDAVQLAGLISARFFKERLRTDLSGAVVGLGLGLGWLARAEVGYVPLDGMDVGVGYIHYEDSKRFSPVFGFDRHDRVYTFLRKGWTL